MEHTELVPNDSSKYNKNTNNILQSRSTITRGKQKTSTVPRTKASCIPFIEQHIRTQDIPESQQTKLFWPHGEQQLKTDTTQHAGNGRNDVVRETLIAFNQL